MTLRPTNKERTNKHLRRLNHCLLCVRAIQGGSRAALDGPTWAAIMDPAVAAALFVRRGGKRQRQQELPQ